MLIPLHTYVQNDWEVSNSHFYVVILPLLTIFVNICLKSIDLPRAIYVFTENWNYLNSILDQKFKSFGLNDGWDLYFLVFTQCQSINLKAAYVYLNKHTHMPHALAPNC